ncbi:MAG: hypothetical protein KDB14_13640 [Planctomycetales bacterium]|nr:hypothetical protein [Planctomycetales bacterium]
MDSMLAGCRFRLSRAAAWTALVASVLASGLASATPPPVQPRQMPMNPDYLEVRMLINQKCVGCHRQGSEERADLSTYEALLGGEADGDKMIVPGDAEKSALFTYVDWNVNADEDSDAEDEPTMPLDKHEWLTSGQLELVRRWIDNGALEYVLPEHCNITPLTELDYPSARQCKQCHPKQYREWSRSMHAYAQQSPVFEAFNLSLVQRTSGTIGTFCSRCHTPVGTELGENESVRNVHRSRLSLEGVTCVVCHRRDLGLHKSNGRVSIQKGDINSGCMYGPFESDISGDVNAHKSQRSSYIRTSQFCGECHDVTSPEGVRLEEAFSEWNNSPAAKDGIACHLCHMGPEQGRPIERHHWTLGRAAEVDGVPPEKFPLRRLSDHTFSGPDYSLLPDTEFPRKLDWMYEIDYRNPACLTPYQQKTLEELRRDNRENLEIARTKRYELLRNGAHLCVKAPAVATHRTMDVQVAVQSTTAGHSFPTGFTAERQLWVSVEATDENGRVLFHSGDLDHNHDLRDGHSHEVLTGHAVHDQYLLNFQNKFTIQTQKGSERSVVLSVNRDVRPLNILRPATGISQSFGRPFTFRVAKASLPPLRSIGRKYPIPIPRDSQMCMVRVRLNFRHLPPTLLDHIGTPHLKHQLEVVVIDEKRIAVPIAR